MVDETGKDRAKEQHNRLFEEKSPYLLQHAANPVDWFSWGDEAFEKAKAEDKPIFLSIGYSTCHWCHVMEHESFEDEAVADLMNDAFVSIKVDREEHPEIDNIYMRVCQLVTGSGGWPLSIIMTSDKKPFYAATYIPRDSRYGHIGMMELIPRIKELWRSRRDDILQSSIKITDALSQASASFSDGELSEPILKLAYEQFTASFDSRFGGFGRAPKFPTPHNLLFLLRYWRRSGESRALEMVEKTLKAMRLGGIYDHLGFGFHRYSTDPMWLLPHFEKMLYDQALMAMAYIEAWQVTHKNLYCETARDIFEYVLRDMTDSSGAFYCAEDADSEGEEGRFYLWTEEEIRHELNHDDAELVIRAFGIDPNGNFDEQVTGRRTDANILHLTTLLPELAGELNINEVDLKMRIEKVRRRLFEIRETRPRPHKDDKVLTDWNGLMIAALSLGAQAFNEPRYADLARKAVEFIMARMSTPEGRLWHRYRDGQAAIPANIDDYSYLIWGLINLYEATFDVGFLKDAFELNAIALEHFWDDDSGSFHFTADDTEKLPVRTREVHDGAVPSGNSVAALNLIRLGRISGNAKYDAMANKVFNAFSGQVRRAPQAFAMFLTAFDFAVGPAYEVLITGNPEADDTREMLSALRARFIPNKIVIFKPEDKQLPGVANFAQFVKDLKSIDGKAAAYVCRKYTCSTPTNDIGKMLDLLNVGDSGRRR
ncbi:MAG: thioredoxin [candidate division Zixibacteria bacterium RBG_16_53_22]|nr:MAG: thioredoxin [candidate division Zixibacteria bacterium RBG_16_53_22]